MSFLGSKVEMEVQDHVSNNCSIQWMKRCFSLCRCHLTSCFLWPQSSSPRSASEHSQTFYSLAAVLEAALQRKLVTSAWWVNNLRWRTLERKQTLLSCFQLIAAVMWHISTSTQNITLQTGVRERMLWEKNQSGCRRKRGHSKHTQTLQGAGFHYHNTMRHFCIRTSWM